MLRVSIVLPTLFRNICCGHGEDLHLELIGPRVVIDIVERQSACQLLYTLGVRRSKPSPHEILQVRQL